MRILIAVLMFIGWTFLYNAFDWWHIHQSESSAFSACLPISPSAFSLNSSYLALHGTATVRVRAMSQARVLLCVHVRVCVRAREVLPTIQELSQ